MNIKYLTSDNFISMLQNETRPIIIDFYSDWCPPCKKMLPIMEEIANERQDICVCKVNTQEEPNLAAQFAIKNIPTFIVIKNGQIKNTIVGAYPKQFIIDNI